ncbi:MAG: histidinol-phosphatase [Breznakia sp.]
MKTNYHTHTTRCKHAVGSDEEYVVSAIKGGYTELGFSDHAPWKYESPYVSHIRMNLDDFDDYHRSILKLKEKYAEDIHILIGLEVEYFPKYMDWLKAVIKEKKLDYIILGNHFDGSDEYGSYYGYACQDNDNLKKYKDDAIEALKTGLYSYMAHPDLFMRGRSHFDDYARQISEELCIACKEMNIPLEYNLAGAEHDDRHHVTQYPHPEFWKVASKVGNKVIIGVDAHHNFALERNYYYDQAKQMIASLGLERVEKIPLVNFDVLD